MQNSDLKQKLDLLKSYSVIYDGANIKDTIDTLEGRIDQNEFKDKFYVTYKVEDYTAYGLAIVAFPFENITDQISFGGIVGIETDTFIEIATVGAKFRYNLYTRFDDRVSDTVKDFTIYCKVEF